MPTDYAGKRLRRHDGIVHVVERVTGYWYGTAGLMLHCGRRAKYQPRGNGQNKIVDACVSCLGCLAGQK